MDEKPITPAGPPIGEECQEYAFMEKWIDGQRYVLFMHDVIMKPQEGQYVHHINGDGLNNTKENMEIRNRM